MFLKLFMPRNQSFSSLPTGVMKKLTHQQDYETCINVLNSLQSNAQYIKLKAQSTKNHSLDQLTQVKKYLNRTGLSLDKLDELSVIHVAGTKGKGTTCALSERILREHGYKTGFFSSPHLLEVRERIRINGKPINRSEFADSFWKVYTLLDDQKSEEGDMPLYFRFLTIMAFNIFLEMKVDVAIIEVGIGGEYDCTNVLRKVPVVGITSLGIDHTSLLGSTIESIAWNKGGIMKKGCQAFTVCQPETAMEVLRQRSVEKECQLSVVDTLPFKLPLGTMAPPHILNLNASLAIALCQAWLAIKHNNNETKSPLLSKEVTERAVSSFVWPGRFQVIQEKSITYYLDGAHTSESVAICSNWFKDVTKHSKRKKALMFNVTGERKAENLFKHLRSCNFDVVLFVTNNAGRCNSSDNTIFKSADELLEKCVQHKSLWLKMSENDGLKTNICEAFPTVIEAVEFLTNQDSFDLLVTGSIHLIGSVLSILDPDLNEY